MALSDHFSVAQLADWVRDARERTLELVADLTDEQLMGPQLSTINPLLWEIGHQAWFQSKWALRHASGLDPVRADEDELYDSIAIAHGTRWDLPLPTREETLDYLRIVRDGVLERLEGREPTEEEIFHVIYSTLHEDMHTEAITYTRQTMGYPAPNFSIVSAQDSSGEGTLPGDVDVPGGTYLLGALRDEPFAFDNEKWAHPVDVPAFSIARACVTQAEFAEFVDDDGYNQEKFWGEDGWKWRESSDEAHPVYWRRDANGDWLRRHFEKWGQLEPHLPVIHVNWFEAVAFCRWAGRRLPTEVEWELAATAEPEGQRASDRKRRFPWGDSPPGPEHANLDWRAMGCVGVGALPEGDSPLGCRQMIGNVWEWTSSDFLPFPEFEPDPYKDYSEPWFGTRKIYRGGCWVTRSRLIRTNYRNFQTPDRRDVWAGFRTCAL